MENINKRLFLFLFGCIGTRSLFVIMAKNINKDYLPLMGYVAIVIALGFSYIYLTGSRQTGPEVFGDKIWWNKLRPIHAMLYLTFAYLAITKNDCAWIPLLIDVIIGLASFLYFHKSKGHI